MITNRNSIGGLPYDEPMRIINPRLCNEKTILVVVEQENAGRVPHVRVYHDKTSNPKSSYVRLDRTEYLTRHGENEKLPDALKEEFIEIMNKPWKGHIIETQSGYRPATGYEAAVDIWSDTYEYGSLDKFLADRDGGIAQLDYSKL